MGRFPFRRLGVETAAELLSLMDKHGIEAAVVGSHEALYGADPYAANLTLCREVAAHRDRLVPFITPDPHFPPCLDEVTALFEDFSLRGVRLFPNYHDYRLGDPACLALVQRVVELGGVVHVPCQYQDWRQMPRYCREIEEVAVEDVVDLAARFPKGRFVIGSVRPSAPVGQSALEEIAALPNLALDLAKVYLAPWVLENGVRDPGADVCSHLARIIGPERLLYASDAPLHDPECVTREVRSSAIPERDKGRIFAGNARALLDLD